ncbi:hypothetical protein [Pelagibacterium montanilacus]|uniref:hypothetical protein n=1 Tax=Pelagibacterium montanilacus TaxID=2185280 RepID=UPI000F8D8690|nr:hypothetical protein [Pelagibacterium montanilacus]
MMETWPESVPHAPLAGTFEASPFREPLATEFEDGPRRSRPRGTLRVATVRFTIRMSNDQFAIFKDWVDGPLVQGTQPFLMPVWSAGAYRERQCSFFERYRENPGHGLRYRVSVVLDVVDY